jgi:hypothetical protein
MTSRKMSSLTDPLTILAAIMLIALICYLRDAAAADMESYLFRLLPKIVAAAGTAIFGGLAFLQGSKVAGACALGVLLALFIPL